MPSILEAALDKCMNASILSDEDNVSGGNIIKYSCCGGREHQPDEVQWARTYYRQGQIYHPREVGKRRESRRLERALFEAIAALLGAFPCVH